MKQTAFLIYSKLPRIVPVFPFNKTRNCAYIHRVKITVTLYVFDFNMRKWVYSNLIEHTFAIENIYFFAEKPTYTAKL